MRMSNSLIATFISAVVLVPYVHAQQPQPPAPAPKPTPITMTGCVSATAATSGQYTFAEAEGLREYRLDGKDISKFAGRRVEVIGGESGKGLTVKGGLWPAPSGGARGVAIDPAQEAVARNRPGNNDGTARAVPEFRVSRIRLANGVCK
jgi:hypothetical protein